MLRPLYLPLISFSILLMASKCTEGCETPNAALGEKVIKLETELTRTIKEQQELGNQLSGLAYLQNALLQAKEELDQFMLLQGQLEQKLAELQTTRAPQVEIEAIQQRLEKVEQAIAQKDVKIKRLESDVQATNKRAHDAKQDTAQAKAAASAAQRNVNELKLELEKAKNDLNLQATKLRSELKNYATMADLGLAKENINELQKDLKGVTEKLAKVSTKEELKLAQEDLTDKIAAVSKKLAATKKELQQDMEQSKTAALAEAKDFATQSIALAKLGLENTLAKQTALDSLKAELMGLIGNQKNIKDDPEFKELKKQIADLQTRANADVQAAKQAAITIADHERKIIELEKDWNATSKARLDETNKKATEALEKATIGATPPTTLPSQEKGDKEAVKGTNTINLNDTEFGIRVNKELEGLQVQIKGIKTLLNGDTKSGGRTVGIYEEIIQLRQKISSNLDEKMVDWGKKEAEAAMRGFNKLDPKVSELENARMAHAERLYNLEKSLKPRVIAQAKELFDRAENLNKRITSIEEIATRLGALEKQLMEDRTTTGRPRSNSSPTPVETPPSERKKAAEATKEPKKNKK